MRRFGASIDGSIEADRILGMQATGTSGAKLLVAIGAPSRRTRQALVAKRRH